VTDHPLRPAKRHSLGEPLPHQQADTTQAPPEPKNLYPCGTIRYYHRFLDVIPEFGADNQRVTHPSALHLNAVDLHVLYTLPALILSQDQTLRK
jgi:hypothetical protein